MLMRKRKENTLEQMHQELVIVTNDLYLHSIET